MPEKRAFRPSTPPENPQRVEHQTPKRAAVIWGDKINEANGRPLFGTQIFASVSVPPRTGYRYQEQARQAEDPQDCRSWRANSS